MSQPPEFLYFDLGKVLLDFDHARMLRQMAEVCGVPADAVRAALMPSGDPRREDPQWRLESGELSDDAYHEYLCGALGVRPDRAALELAASDIFAPIAESVAFVERLRAAGHRIGLLSNTNPIHWRFFMDGRYPWLLDLFEVRIGSFEANAMKPDAAIYEYAAVRAGVPIDRLFFTDDKPENVEGAIAAGLDAAVFTDAATLESDLRSRGVTA